jgi:hypothetical protein
MADQRLSALPQDRTAEQLFPFAPDWSVAQSFFALVGGLPADEESFVSRYGPFENQVSVEQFTGAVRAVNEIAGKLGGSESLKRRVAADGQYLLRPSAPDEVYANIVWVAIQAGSAAKTISSTFELLPGLMQSAGATAGGRAQRARQVLAGEGGLVSTAEAVAGQIQQVRDRLAPYVPPIPKAIVAFNESEVLNQANRAIGGLQSDMRKLQKQAEEEKEKAKGWFGADKAKEQYESLTKQIAECAAEIGRKQQLDSDMGDFFNSANRVAPALSNIGESLRKLAKVFTDTADRIGATCKAASPEQLGDSAWLAGALGVSTEIDRWKTLQTAADNFVQGAFIS